MLCFNEVICVSFLIINALHALFNLAYTKVLKILSSVFLEKFDVLELMLILIFISDMKCRVRVSFSSMWISI